MYHCDTDCTVRLFLNQLWTLFSIVGNLTCSKYKLDTYFYIMVSNIVYLYIP